VLALTIEERFPRSAIYDVADTVLGPSHLAGAGGRRSHCQRRPTSPRAHRANPVALSIRTSRPTTQARHHQRNPLGRLESSMAAARGTLSF